MPKNLDNKGYLLPGILVLVLMLAIGGFVGYTYFSKSKSLNTDSGMLQASAENVLVTSNNDVLQANVTPLPNDTFFRYVFKPTSVTVTITNLSGGNWKRNLTSATNKLKQGMVTVKLTDNTNSSQTKEISVPLTGTAGNTLTFAIFTTTTKIEFPKVNNINAAGLTGLEWIELPTKNGVSRFLCDPKDKPEYLYCYTNWTDMEAGNGVTGSYRGIITGCKANVDAVASALKKDGLIALYVGIENTSESNYYVSSKISPSVTTQTNSVGRYLANITFSFERKRSYYSDAFPATLVDTKSPLVRDGKAKFFDKCSDMDVYLNSVKTNSVRFLEETNQKPTGGKK